MAKKSAAKPSAAEKTDVVPSLDPISEILTEEEHFDFASDSAGKHTPHITATPADFNGSDAVRLKGTEKDDALTGSAGTDLIDGGKGNDHLDGAEGDDYITAGHGDDLVTAGAGNDFVKAGKGDDTLIGGEGDDVLDGGHGNDLLDGGAGSDILNGDKGDDSLIFTLAENAGSNDLYDGGKGHDSLVLRMSKKEYAEHEAEINELKNWMAENANEVRSTSKQFNDASANSAEHPVFETSFGLTVRNIEDLQVEITDPAESEVTAVVTGDGPMPLKQMDVSLVEGSQITVDVEVSVEELPAKYDVFMLHDLSGSFWNDLPNVQSQFSGLYDALTADSDVAFGVGSFVDKPMETFGSKYDYVYNTDLSVTADKETIQESLDNLRTSSGWDWPESQMEALVQTALRDEEIGFREGAQKFAVLFTDAPYHKEGDYEVTRTYDSATGTYVTEAVADNDYDTEFEVEDYPNPEVVGKMLIDAGITPVFAVTPAYMSHYQELVDDWGVGVVTELTSDSSNIAEAITNGLTEAPLNLELEAVGDEFGFVASVEPPVYENAEPGNYTFTVTMEIPEDSPSYSSDTLTLEVTGYGEVDVNVAIEQIDITGDSTNDTLVGDAGPNAIYGMDGDDTLIGTGGSDHLFGGSGNDTISGGLAADTLTGGSGNDTFVFASGDGNDTITDFEAGDVLDLRRVSSAESAADILAAATQVEADTVLDLGDGDSITLQGVDSASLSADNLLL